MLEDIRGPYFRGLDESQRPREYWRGLDPDDKQTAWFFETVEDGALRIAIKQMILHPAGAIDRYWWKHLQDENGGLADQPVDYTEELRAISADDFYRVWHR